MLIFIFIFFLVHSISNPIVSKLFWFRPIWLDLVRSHPITQFLRCCCLLSFDIVRSCPILSDGILCDLSLVCAVSVEDTAQTACTKLFTAFKVPEVVGSCLQLLDASKLFKALRSSSNLFEDIRTCPELSESLQNTSRLLEAVWRCEDVRCWNNLSEVGWNCLKMSGLVRNHLKILVSF